VFVHFDSRYSGCHQLHSPRIICLPIWLHST